MNRLLPAFGAVALSASVIFKLTRPPLTAPFRGADGSPDPKSVTEIVRLEINENMQWLTIRGRANDEPVLLFLHGGPGTPETPFIRRWNPDIEEQAVVVYWEQRGAGKSYRSRPPAETMTMEQFIRDAQAVTHWLQKRFQRRQIVLMGHSWGTLLGMRLIARSPQDYAAYIGISQTSHACREDALIQEWLIDEARRRRNKKALRELRSIQPGACGRISRDDLSTKLKWVNSFGGAAFRGSSRSFAKLVWAVLNADEYTLLDKLNYSRGENFSLKHLFDEFSGLNLFGEVDKVDVPVFFFHGRHDYQVPMAAAREYFEHLRAPHKEFHIFEESAHGVLIEEPEKFNRLLSEILGRLEQIRRSQGGQNTVD